MSWYWIVSLVIFYIVMWTITAIAFSRWSKNPDADWVFVGMLWPFILPIIPIVYLICGIGLIVEKYTYKEDKQ